jgi:hypothetical protein
VRHNVRDALTCRIELGAGAPVMRHRSTADGAMSYLTLHVFSCCKQRDSEAWCGVHMQDIDEIIDPHIEHGPVIGRLEI